MGENYFLVCEEVQHNRVFVGEGRREGGGAKNARIYMPSRGMNAKNSDLMLAKHLNTTLNTQGVMQGSQEEKRANLWGPRAHFLANISMKIVGEFSLVCCTFMAHAGNTKIWGKIISTRAPNAATKPATSEKSSYFSQSQNVTLREQLLGDASVCDMAKHAARENNLAAGTTSVEELIFPQTPQRLRNTVLWLSISSLREAILAFLSRGIKNIV